MSMLKIWAAKLNLDVTENKNLETPEEPQLETLSPQKEEYPTIDLDFSSPEKKDDKFRRVNKNDLIYIQKITLAQALNSEPVKITTLDNRKIAITMDEIISPQTVKIVKGEGMPVYKKDTDIRDLSVKKGDLFIKFDIEFPEYIEPEKKEEIIRLLKEDEEELKEDEEEN